jgi:thiol:disulfide interchange protein DsbD
MENNVWSDDNFTYSNESNCLILYMLMISVQLKEQFVSKTTGSEIETVGDKWTDFMISTYKTNTQPLYVNLLIQKE